MERNRYIELCQINSVSSKKEKVLYERSEYIPIEFILWFVKGKPQNTAYMRSVIGNCYIRSSIEDLEEIKK